MLQGIWARGDTEGDMRGEEWWVHGDDKPLWDGGKVLNKNSGDSIS